MANQAIALDSYPTDSRGFNRPSSAPITRTTNWKEDFCPDIDTSSFSNYMEPTPSFIITTIEELYNLPKKACIDTHDARTTLERAVADAIRFIAKLKVVTKPLISASEDGDVVLQWHTGSAGAVVEFEGDGHFGYALLKYDRYVPGEYEGRLTDDLPPDLDTAISQENV